MRGSVTDRLKSEDNPLLHSPAAFWDGTPKGEEVDIGGLHVYLSESTPRAERAVIIVSDIHGWDLANTRLLADKYAALGLTAAVPDLFKGDGPDLAKLQKGDFTGFDEWRHRHLPDTVIPDLEKVIDGLKKERAVKSVGIVGNCWGGKFAAILGGTDKVQAVVINHGSFVTDEEVSALRQPILINAADNDKHISRERLSHIRALLDANANHVPSDVKFYEGMRHGWTVKGDAKDPAVGPQVVNAFERASGWFRKHL